MTTGTKPTVGWIGLGAMGSRMARRLLEAGYSLTVYNRETAKRQPFAQAGAKIADSPRQVAEQSQIVFSSLTNDAVVEQVYGGPDGVLAGAQPGALLVEMSTILPATVQHLAQQAQAKDVAFLDAPVSGSTPQAEAGQLVVLAGGNEHDFQRAQPLFEAIGKGSFLVGPVGQGAAMKLVVNTLLGLGLQALAEALALGERSGLTRETLLDVLSQTAHVSPGQKGKMENVRRDDYPAQFPMRLLHKDFGLALDQAEKLNVPLPMTAAAQQMFALQTARDGEADCSAIIRLMRDLSKGMT